MNILDWMNAPEGYVSRHTDMPAQRQTQAKTLCWEYNRTAPFEGEKRARILGQLLGTCHPLTFIEPDFHCDYGFNIHTHGLTVINYNCVILDTSRGGDRRRRLYRAGLLSGLLGPLAGCQPACRRHRHLPPHHAGRKCLAGCPCHRLRWCIHRRWKRHRSGQRRHPGYSRRCGCRRQSLQSPASHHRS